MLADDGGRVVHSALTGETHYTCTERMLRPLQRGQSYRWLVIAIVPGVGEVVVSETRTFSIQGEESSALARLFLAGMEEAKESAVGQIVFQPPDGATVTTQQPSITVSYPQAKAVGLYLDGVDVSQLCRLEATQLTFDPPRPLEVGDHELAMVVITVAGERLEAYSRFTVDLQSQPAQTESQAPDTEGAQKLPPIRLQLDLLTQGTDEQVDLDDFGVGITVAGGFKLGDPPSVSGNLDINAYRPLQGAFDLTNFLVTANSGQNALTLSVGDVDIQHSEFTVAGLTSRAAKLDWSFGGFKLTATKTLGEKIGRTNTGIAPELFVASFGTEHADEGRGVKVVYVDTEQELGLGASTMERLQDAKVWSVMGHYPLMRGVDFKAEYASSRGSMTDLMGNPVRRSGKVVTSSNSDALEVGLTFAHPKSPQLDLRYQRSTGEGDPFGMMGASGNRETQLIATLSYGNEVWDASLSYTRTNFDDLFDVVDPMIDIPQDTDTNNWSLGLGACLGRWNLRADWNASIRDRFDRDPLTLTLLSGSDTDRSLRFQAEYRLTRSISTTFVWGHTRTMDLLRVGESRLTDTSLRLNFLLGGGTTTVGVGGSGGFTITLEYRHTSSVAGGAKFRDDISLILLNDSQLFPLR